MSRETTPPPERLSVINPAWDRWVEGKAIELCLEEHESIVPTPCMEHIRLAGRIARSQAGPPPPVPLPEPAVEHITEVRGIDFRWGLIPVLRRWLCRRSGSVPPPT